MRVPNPTKAQHRSHDLLLSPRGREDVCSPVQGSVDPKALNYLQSTITEDETGCPKS